MAGVPTQVAHPGKAILRTFVAALVAVALAWVARTVGVNLAEFDQVIIDGITGVVWAIVLGSVQWLMSHPKVMPFLIAIGLGTGVEREDKVQVSTTPFPPKDHG